MTIVLFGCKSTTAFLLEALKQNISISYIITISPEAGEQHEVADYTDLSNMCKTHQTPCYTAKRYDLKSQHDFDAIATIKPDLGFVIGWQRLIPEQILSLFPIGVFGMHGSTDNLPIGRGRSPMNWALIERRKHFFTNLFKYDCGIDSGDILDTFVFSIQSNDTAESMHYKNMLAMKKLITSNCSKLIERKLSLTKQENNNATYYPKRSPENSCIDWESDIFQVEAFIRAVTKPFNGAFSFIDKKKLIIWRASIFETDLVNHGYLENPVGTILEVFLNDKFLVKCRGGILLVHEFNSNIKIRKGKKLFSPSNCIKSFIRNRFGFHDC